MNKRRLILRLTIVAVLVVGGALFGPVAGTVWNLTGATLGAVLALALFATVAFLPRLIRRLKGPRFTDAPTLKHWLESGKTVALIDVRSAEEFSGPLGHITGALNIPLAELVAGVSAVDAQPLITI